MSPRTETIDAYCTLGVDREYNFTPAALLAAMDAAQVDRAIIAPVDRALAVFNREGNSAMLDAARAHPRRFLPACSVNPWYGAAATTELARALARGARMLVLHPAVQGYLATDELVFPILALAQRERVPVYIHTGPPGSATPHQVAELALRFPAADFLIGHSGATDFWNDAVDAALSAPNVSLESSLARPFQFARYLERTGPAKGICGSGAPLNDLAFEWEQMRRNIPETFWPQVASGNLQALLEKRGAL
jgi:predicted TIM-barrel fold metal-dependent hydrolase